MKRIAPNESKKDKTASNVEIVNAFFTRDPVDRNLWICKCGKKRKQEPKTGYTNLVNHVKHEHTDVIEETLKKQKQGALDKFFVPSSKAINIYGWLDWIISEGYIFRYKFFFVYRFILSDCLFALVRN